MLNMITPLNVLIVLEIIYMIVLVIKISLDKKKNPGYGIDLAYLI